MNPFSDDIVNEPRTIEAAVPGLNDEALEVLVQDFTRLLEQETLPGAVCPRPLVRLVTSPEPGYGKSHIIGRLFARLSKSATLVNVRPFQVPESAWKSLLLHTMQELQFPERGLAATDTGQALQLEVFAHGVVSRLMVETFSDESRYKNKQKFIEIKKDPLASYALSKESPVWARLMGLILRKPKKFTQIHGIFASRFFPQSASTISWLRVLLAIACRPKDAELQVACLCWLKGDALSSEDAEKIGLHAADMPRWDESSCERNQLAKKRLMDVCSLAAFFRPFLFCFDQTETYGDNQTLARSMGQLIQDMWQELPQQMTVLTTNQYPWLNRIVCHWEEAARQRLAPALPLKGINLEQGKILLANRLRRSQADEQMRRLFMDQAWLSSLFLNINEMPVRTFLRQCQQRWQEIHANPPLPIPTLTEIFAATVQELKRSPRRLVFDESVLFFAAETALGRGMHVERERGDFAITVRAIPPDARRLLRVVMDRSSHWNHWRHVAGAAAQQECCWVCLRTWELPVVPGPAWQVAPDIRRVIDQGRLRFEVIGREELATLHAAWDIYAKAVAGDILHDKDDVLRFLYDTLQGLRERLLGVHGGDALKKLSCPSHPAGFSSL